MKRGPYMFYIQDGNFSKSLTTHEAILTVATGSNNIMNYGAGVFAFATSGGASLVFEDRILRNFLSTSNFTLIVGIDDITNTNTLKKLRELRDVYQPKLEIKVFCHNDLNSIFHPKFVWFNIDGEIRLITGSGNLTERGLRRNREAFTISRYTDEAISGFEDYWNLWIKENEENLYDLDDERVTRKVAQNSVRYGAARRWEVEPEAEEDAIIDELATVGINEEAEVQAEQPEATQEILEVEDYEAWTIEDNFEVLVAEIPNSGNRWKQANFNVDVFKGFFGGVAGVNEERRILLRHVDATGNLEELEVRPTVSVRSQNYRVELNAAAGLEYPNGDERPIGVFIKVSTRTFIYSLVMPGNLNYNEVVGYLNNSQPRVGNRMRRYLTNVEGLRRNCPNLGFWSI